MYRIKIKGLTKWKLSNNRKPLVFLGKTSWKNMASSGIWKIGIPANGVCQF